MDDIPIRKTLFIITTCPNVPGTVEASQTSFGVLQASLAPMPPRVVYNILFVDL
jgi:hypothetical protein